MTKANMMREAHKMAKTFEGDYTACLALALKTINSEGGKTMVEEAKTITIKKLEQTLEDTGYKVRKNSNEKFAYKCLSKSNKSMVIVSTLGGIIKITVNSAYWPELKELNGLVIVR